MVVAALVGLASTATPSTQPRALAVGTVAVQFEGTAHLPHFPCRVGATDCTSEFAGWLTGELAGRAPTTGGGQATWSAVLADAGLGGTFVYEDTSCVFGTAVGVVTGRAAAPNVAGTYDDGGGPLPRKVQGIELQLSVSWQRSGVNAVLFFDDLVVSLDVVGLGWVQVAFDGRGTGTAVFVPGLHPGDPPPPCLQTPPPFDAPSAEATVVGAATVVI